MVGASMVGVHVNTELLFKLYHDPDGYTRPPAHPYEVTKVSGDIFVPDTSVELLDEEKIKQAILKDLRKRFGGELIKGIRCIYPHPQQTIVTIYPKENKGDILIESLNNQGHPLYNNAKPCYSSISEVPKTRLKTPSIPKQEIITEIEMPEIIERRSRGIKLPEDTLPNFSHDYWVNDAAPFLGS